MSGLFTQLLLTTLALAAPALVAVLAGRPARPRLRGTYRNVLSAGGVAGTALVLGAATGASPWRTLLVAALLGVVVLGFGPGSRSWTVPGLLTWSLTITAGAAYLASGLVSVVQADDPDLTDRVGEGVLWVVELLVLVLVLGRVWELVDVLARWDWERRTELQREVAGARPRRRGPFVSLHVPTHNEPPDMVIETLNRLLELDYDDFEVLVVDNNTDDPVLWRPVERFCRSHEKLGFFHLVDWPGHKAGALNYALDKVDPRTQIIGVVDADQHVDADFLARCVPLFDDEALAFVQTRQDHRDWEGDPYFRRLHQSYAQSFGVVQGARNERNAPVLGATTSLVCRDALVEVGGWDEWCISEDAELGLRLLRAGWSGAHVDRAFGRGIMPLTFEALKRQRFRWCFGGVQLLRLHWRSLLFGRRTDVNDLTRAQRWTYLSGGLQWFADLAALLLTGLLVLGAVVAADGRAAPHVSAPLVVSMTALVALGWLRSVALGRRAGHTWRDAAGALGLSLAVGWVVAFASLRGLVAREGAFLRTPTVRRDVSWRGAVRANVVETSLAVLCVAGAVAGFAAGVAGRPSGFLVGLLLLLQGAGYAAAPVSSQAALNADLTPELRRRRREALVSWTRVVPGMRRRNLGPVLGTGVATAVALLVFAPGSVGVLDGLSDGEAHGSTAGPAQPRTTDVLPSQSWRSPLSPLAPMLSTPTSTAATSPATETVRPLTTLSSSGGARPSHAATAPPTPAPTTHPTTAPASHGRPTWLPTKPTKHH